MELNRKAFFHNFKKREGIIMYPTSHDIIPETIDYYLQILLKMVSFRDTVLRNFLVVWIILENI